MKKVVDGVKSLIERIVLWTLRAFLFRYSAVVAKHFSQRDAESAAFKAEVIEVAKDHWNHLNDLDSRLKALEAR